MKEKPNIFTLRSIACNIFQKCYSLPKPEGHEIQKLRVIENAAKLIQTDIKAVETRKDIHPSAEDISMSCCANAVIIWVQIFHRNIARTWFLSILSKSSEVSAKCCCFTTS